MKQRWDPADADRIASLDPLDATGPLRNLPLLNDEADVDRIISDLKAILPSSDRIAAMDFFEAAAAMRDIGMYLGSIRKHELEPQEAIPELGRLLPELAKPTGLPPRDNVLHYVSWNPAGRDMRTYTRCTEERELIEGVRRIAPIVFSVVDSLRELRTLPSDSDRFAELIGDCVRRTEMIVEAIRRVRVGVDPVVFAIELRPYFDSIVVNGVEYKGPGAVEIPLFIIDHLLWSSSLDDSLLREFQETYLPDQLPYLRDCFLRARGTPSLSDRIENDIGSAESPPLALWESAKHVHHLLEILVRFRGPHLFLARKAYDVASQSNYTKGSGGYEPDVVKAILDLTVSERKRVRAILQRAPTELFEQERLPSWYPKKASTS